MNSFYMNMLVIKAKGKNYFFFVDFMGGNLERGSSLPLKVARSYPIQYVFSMHSIIPSGLDYPV